MDRSRRKKQLNVIETRLKDVVWSVVKPGLPPPVEDSSAVSEWEAEKRPSRIKRENCAFPEETLIKCKLVSGRKDKMFTSPKEFSKSSCLLCSVNLQKHTESVCRNYCVISAHSICTTCNVFNTYRKLLSDAHWMDGLRQIREGSVSPRQPLEKESAILSDWQRLSS